MYNKKRIVIALGGNALGNTPTEQIYAVKRVAESIADFAEQGYEIVIGHGNGPQVGMINMGLDYASSSGPHIPQIPFAECDAMSQGYIGYHLQQALSNIFQKRHMSSRAASVITQVLVDPKDPAFFNPTKPVGAFYTKEQADRAALEKGWIFMEDAGRGYRRVVPSPAPEQIVELEVISKMLQSGLITIAAGGGGIPVIKIPQGLMGVDAVIDKDRSCARMAIELEADCLLILTAVDRVSINYNRPDQKDLFVVSAQEAKNYIKEGQFAVGSMLPKVEACLDFITACPGKSAIITSLEKSCCALDQGVGTRFYA